jgi:BirA family biotin operon repressor/biotin-[acetyl-CoA-carboxylase] ligase
LQNNTFSTLFVGQNLIKLSAVDSTNNFLKRMVSNSEPLPEGTVIMAENQYAGRGQSESSWLAEPGKNLTFSLLLHPVFLPLTAQFRLNMAVSLAIHQALKIILPKGLTIKWPNDIYYVDKKIGGMLIENIVSGGKIKACIIGIGINVNQEFFEGGLESRAGSISQILHEHVNLIWLLTQICSHIEVTYLKLRAGSYLTLREEYLSSLYRFNVKAAYRQNGELIEGRITNVSDTGFLTMETASGPMTYNFKEIEFINQPK